MMSILSTKYRKHIALFLYGLFFMEFSVTAEMPHGTISRSWPGLQADIIHLRRLPGITGNAANAPLFTAPEKSGRADSIVVPDRKTAARLLMASPTFRKGQRALADRPISLGALAGEKKADIGGPNQPEMQSFQSVNGNNMVDLFSGDFSYNIPLLDVGGYPVNIAYHSGRSMEEDASWVGLGWNINPGTITRDMRGLPDDFNGNTDTVKKVSHIKDNVSWGVNAGIGVELLGLSLEKLKLAANFSLGVFHTTYNGFGLEKAVNVSLQSGEKNAGSFSGGLGISNNSQTGFTINPSLGASYTFQNAKNNISPNYGVQIGSSYNTRTGLKDIGLNFTSSLVKKAKDGNHPEHSNNTDFAGISFSWPTYTPTINMPMTNANFSLTVKLGTLAKVSHPNLSLTGYYGKQYIAAADTAQTLPAYGYLNFQNRTTNWGVLMDYNREKEIPYREKPAVPHIGVPSYTYDAFTIAGEGTGGMFRAYRGDIGFVSDHLLSDRSLSGSVSLDLGAGDILHDGVDLYGNFSSTTTGPWLAENPLKNTINFRSSKGIFEAAYFRNPGEKAINSSDFYNAIGGDDVVAVKLNQPGNSSPSITTTPVLNRYDGKKLVGSVTLDSMKALRPSRDKRSQVISYLTADEASIGGLDKYIYHHAVNQFWPKYCENDVPDEPQGDGSGFMAYYYANGQLGGSPVRSAIDTIVRYNWSGGSPFYFIWNGHYQNLTDPSFPLDRFSVRWLGRIKAPATGTYKFGVRVDDGVRLWINDSLYINDWKVHGNTWDTVGGIVLEKGKFYNIRLEYFEYTGVAVCQLGWLRPDHPTAPFTPDSMEVIGTKNMYQMPTLDTIEVNPTLTRENRVNSFRKSNHLSEIDVLNPDGRRYVYGIPVYNLIQKESSFSIGRAQGNNTTGLAYYTETDNSINNGAGKQAYYSREEIPAYAHSFLLTGILSPDYVDVTGDGISDDDIGDAVKFNYSKTSGIVNPFGWRAPYVTDSASYSPGFRSYDRDDKAHFIYGQKELWYLHSIESKTMVATFTLQPRADMMECDERGNKDSSGKAMCLKQIDLYSKADLLANNGNAVPIKTVHFEYSYELCRGGNQPVNDSGKLTLKRIWFTYNGNDKGIKNPYVFNYHPNNPRYKVNSADKWGTYKDASQNPGYTTAVPMTNAEYPYSLQDSTTAAANAGAWALDSIQLPSGGRIKVNYESDDYAYVQNRRSTLMCQIAGIGFDTSSYSNKLYNFTGSDGLIVYIKVPYAVSGNQDLYARYLEGLSKIYFKLFVSMPKDDFGSGSEYIPCYADLDTAASHWYGVSPHNSNLIWIKIKGINKTGDGDGNYSPLGQTAINFLRLNLPSKAYPGSEINDGLSISDGVKILLSMFTNIENLLIGYSNVARSNGWARNIDTTFRSWARLDCPNFKKLGGGSRVKSVLIYDNWNAMTGQKETVYGQTYDYTTFKTVNGDSIKVSSGVAAWEPVVGSEENPFHLPIEYVEKASVLAPATMQYTEEPLGESFFPGPSVGYSKVRVRSIHTTGTRSANGYAESGFYTSYDFPTLWDWSMLDNDTKKRYKPILQNLLRINAKNIVTLSQGFKVELNDMNGKPRSEATYSETDSLHPISYTENFYKVDDGTVQAMHLNNTVPTIDPHGNININSTIGKDAELMTDMRDQTTENIGSNIEINSELFSAGVIPVLIPILLNLYQHETQQFRSVAATKVIQRYGILDSVVHIDKGSKITSHNLLYDAETGEPLLVQTENEFNDSLFDFTYPSHWVYAGAGPAYQNIDYLLKNITISSGKIVNGLTDPQSLMPGDEVLAYSEHILSSSGTDCTHQSDYAATFPDAYKLWVVDTSSTYNPADQLFLMDQYGTPFSGKNVTLKVIRSGHRNTGSTIGSVTSLVNPMVADGSGNYHLVFDTSTHVIHAGAVELKQLWRVPDIHRTDNQTTCVYTPQDSALAAAEGCSCLAPLFNYLISHNQLFITRVQNKTVGSLVNDANANGAGINMSSCPILSNNASLPFYALTRSHNASIYQARLGSELISLQSVSGLTMRIDSLVSNGCDAQGRVKYKDPGAKAAPIDTVTININPVFSTNLFSAGGVCPPYADSSIWADTLSDHLMVENSLLVNGFNRNSAAVMRFYHPDWQIPINSTILSAKLILQADTRGHIPGVYNNANSVNPIDTVSYSISSPAGWFPYQPLDTMLYQAYYTPWFAGARNGTAFQNDTVDVTSYLQGYIAGTYPSSSFILTQGSQDMHSARYDSAMVTNKTVPPYLLSGYSNYYSTFYNERYSDPSKRPVMQVQYIKAPGLTDTAGALLMFNATVSCSTVSGRTCYSAVTDTIVNPYQYALLGNYRPQRSYVYYGRRKESDPLQPTNIRTNGVISNFAPFWTLQSGQWAPAYDTTRWVWNSESTLFNRKGFEIENRDPLGRYNTGLYGYGLTLPTAVVQNGHFQESAFEGFEDYGFSIDNCGATCAETRPFDFSAYTGNISDSIAHTGLYSLRLDKNGSISLINLPVAAAADPLDPSFSDSAFSNSCGSQLGGVKTSSGSVLPSFKPFAGKKMLISAWVKEKVACNCQQYTRNHIVVNYSLAGGGVTAYQFSPSGNIIEGWQRYEGVMTVPSNATAVTIVLQGSDSSVTYFDDIRLLPFNGEMKSYVYDPVSLRLMAELDENNYATFYEYDDDGTLIRVKKETERGVMTIKETHSALLKTDK